MALSALCSLLIAATSVQTFPKIESFRIIQDRSGHWLQGPDGKRLWSLGVDCVGFGEKGKPDNPSYDGASLFASPKAWAQDTLQKFHSWGINTLGGWSESERFDSSIPYVEVLHLGSYDKAPWHDLFSPECQTVISNAAKDLIPKHSTHTNLIGFFTDNELGWWDDTLFVTYFGLTKEAPGKLALVESLKKTYKSQFKLFQADWKSTARSFDQLLSEKRICLRPGTMGVRAVHDFNGLLASKYYQLVHDLVRKYDPYHLILGDRYCQYYNLETVKASVPWIDVVSTNSGSDWTDGTYSPFFFETLHRITQKPVMITEFYFSAMENRTGNRNSGDAFPKVKSQAQRAIGFKNCLKQLASMPFIIGAHWFQFNDEPPKGRGDGEDWNFGLVDIHGVPYTEMIQVLKGFDPFRERAHTKVTTSSRIPKAPPGPMDSHMLNWQRNQGRILSKSADQFGDLYLCHDRNNLYLGVAAMDYADASLYENYKMPEIDRPRLQISIGKFMGELRYGFSKPIVKSAGIGAVAERSGLKEMLTICIPASSLGKHSILKGEKIQVKAILTSHGRGYQMSWEDTRTCD